MATQKTKIFIVMLVRCDKYTLKWHRNRMSSFVTMSSAIDRSLPCLPLQSTVYTYGHNLGIQLSLFFLYRNNTHADIRSTHNWKIRNEKLHFCTWKNGLTFSQHGAGTPNSSQLFSRWKTTARGGECSAPENGKLKYVFVEDGRWNRETGFVWERTLRNIFVIAHSDVSCRMSVYDVRAGKRMKWWWWWY